MFLTIANRFNNYNSLDIPLTLPNPGKERKGQSPRGPSFAQSNSAFTPSGPARNHANSWKCEFKGKRSLGSDRDADKPNPNDVSTRKAFPKEESATHSSFGQSHFVCSQAVLPFKESLEGKPPADEPPILPPLPLVLKNEKRKAPYVTPQSKKFEYRDWDCDRECDRDYDLMHPPGSHKKDFAAPVDVEQPIDSNEPTYCVCNQVDIRVASGTLVTKVAVICLAVQKSSSTRLHYSDMRKWRDSYCVGDDPDAVRAIAFNGNLLEQLKITELKRYPETREPLEHLEDALRRFGSFVMIVELPQKCNFTLWSRSVHVTDLTPPAKQEADRGIEYQQLVWILCENDPTPEVDGVGRH
ncbi:PHD finger protein ING2 [Capsicum annuum]|nr:PHD finger protein ING2 [Capsicum annuum]